MQTTIFTILTTVFQLGFWLFFNIILFAAIGFGLGDLWDNKLEFWCLVNLSDRMFRFIDKSYEFFMVMLIVIPNCYFYKWLTDYTPPTSLPF